MKRLPMLLLIAALLLGTIGVVVAVVQPGMDDDTGTETAQPDVTETDTETLTEDTTGTTGAAVGGDVTTSTTAPDPTATSTTTTQPSGSAPGGTTGTGGGSSTAGSGGGSGLDAGGDTPADLEDGLADTGGATAVGAALALGVAGLALRRRTA